MPTADDNGNGKVTLALLGQKVDHLSTQIDRLVNRFDSHLDETKARDTAVALLNQRAKDECEDIDELRDELKALQKRSYALDGVNAALAVLAGILGFGNR